MEENKLLVTKAELLAREAHTKVNQTYGGDKPYHFHLKMVYNNAKEFIQLIPEEDQAVVLAASWVHDMIEDCRYTYNDIKEELGERVADIVYACTDEKGRTRAERKNSRYYKTLTQSPLGVYVKLCDIKANREYSSSVKGGMYMKYRKEWPKVKQNLKAFVDSYTPLIEAIEAL